MDVMALMSASEINNDHQMTHGSCWISAIIGGPGDTMLTLMISRKSSTDLPRAGQDLIILMNSLRQAPAP